MDLGERGLGDAPAGLLSRRLALGFGAATLAGLGLAACGNSSNDDGSPSSPATGDATAVATEAYVFGYPLVLMDATRRTSAPVNSFDHGVLPNPSDKEVVRLNLDTLYSQAWIDLSAEPMVLHVPAMDADRYWLMQILDAWSNTRHNPSSLKPHITSGVATPPFTYLLTGPAWRGTAPPDMTVLPMPTDTAWLIGRIQINGASDVGAVTALQQQLKLVALSAWVTGDRDNTRSRVHTTVEGAVPPSKQVTDMDGSAFFERMCAVMAANPPAREDADAMRRFATIGITPGGKATLSPDMLNAAAGEAKKRIPAYKNPQIKDENGWLFATNVGTYGTDYPQRAYIAWSGLGANLPQDAIYPTLFGAAAERGAPRRYRLRFAPGELPPVDAFWSITAYDQDSFFVPNPANIYAVGHQIPLTPGPDGAVEIVVQHDNPGPSVPAGHWLPIPATGQFSLTLRLYAPKPDAINGAWKPPALAAVSGR